MYNLTNFNIETIMYSAGNDWLADPQDVKLLVENLQPSILKSHTEIPPWMHLDFICKGFQLGGFIGDRISLNEGFICKGVLSKKRVS